jgi:flagellar motor switch protein FliG
VDDSKRVSGVRKAAVLLVMLGEDAASTIFKNLNQQELDRVTREIAELDRVPPELVNEVLEEYYRMVLAAEHDAQGGRPYALRVLAKAFGDEAARTLLQQVERPPEVNVVSLESLRRTDPQQLARFLESEHPQTIALILAHMDTRAASDLLMKLPEETRGEAVKRLAQLRQFSPEMAQKVSLVMHKRLQGLGEQSRQTYAGFRSVAELLNRLEPNTSKAILDAVEQESPTLAVNIRNLMFTFEDFLTVQDAGVRELLAATDKKTLATALKGASENLRSHFFKCMSSRAVEMLKEDIDLLGAIRAREISKAQQEIVATARKLEADGKIVLKMETEDEYVV